MTQVPGQTPNVRPNEYGKGSGPHIVWKFSEFVCKNYMCIYVCIWSFIWTFYSFIKEDTKDGKNQGTGWPGTFIATSHLFKEKLLEEV